MRGGSEGVQPLLRITSDTAEMAFGHLLHQWEPCGEKTQLIAHHRTRTQTRASEPSWSAASALQDPTVQSASLQGAPEPLLQEGGRAHFLTLRAWAPTDSFSR